MGDKVIFVERPRYTLVFSGLNVAAGTQQTSVSGGLTFRYRIVEVKLYFLDDAVPDMRYSVWVGTTPSGSTTGDPEGTNILSPYSGQTVIRGSQGMVKLDPMYEVNETKTYVKVHLFNNDAVYAVDYMATVTVERLD